MKKIGLLVNTSGEKLVINSAYYQFASQFGDVKLIHPTRTNRKELDSLNLFIGIGGADIYPLKYNQAPMYNGAPCDEFEYFDFKYLPYMLDNKIPMFGICRFFQAINVALGGDMIQDIGVSGTEHKTSSYRGEKAHDVHFYNKDGSFKSMGFGVNSLHHQSLGRIGEDLYVNLSAVEKKKKQDPVFIPESIVSDKYPISAVQWHPEELYAWDSCKEAQQYVNTEIERIIK